MASRPRKSRKSSKPELKEVNALTSFKTAVDLGVHTQIAELKKLMVINLSCRVTSEPATRRLKSRSSKS